MDKKERKPKNPFPGEKEVPSNLVLRRGEGLVHRKGIDVREHMETCLSEALERDGGETVVVVIPRNYFLFLTQYAFLGMYGNTA